MLRRGRTTDLNRVNEDSNKRTELAGRRVGRYEVLRRLGVGGMGDVYLARDLELGRAVALKVLRPELGRDGAPVRRFLQEARAAGGLNHPHICTVYELGRTPDDQYFIAMEHVEGRSLRQVLAEGRVSVPAAVSVLRQASEALGAAHRAGITHRDVKPENLMLRPDGYVKVLDFGLAKLTHGGESGGATLVRTAAGMIMGTPVYMSPEQAQGFVTDARTDVWSLGVVLYELVAGQVPFVGDTVWALLSAVMLTEPAPLGTRAPGVPAELERVATRALSKSPEARYQSAAELAAALGRVEAELDLERRRTGSEADRDVGFETTASFRRRPVLPTDVSRPGPPTNLSGAIEPLVGRARELAEIVETVRRDDVRLVTLSGPGGAGKTRLARASAHELLHIFADGAYFVDLSHLRDPSLVVATIAQVFDLKESRGRSLSDVLGEHLRARSLLLVLDNFEQLLDAAPSISRLLDVAPRLKLLVTSRARLHIRAEREYPVPSLDLPSPERQLPLSELERTPAVALFVERARTARDGFELTERNARAVVEICRRLDGLPLALELAAARLRLLEPEVLLARLADRLKVLTGGARDVPERQQTMRGTISWSFELLDADERRVFERLAVFTGGCSIEQAEEVCAAGRPLSIEVLDAVTSLVEKSLVRRARGAGGRARLKMLEVMREYALERLGESGDYEAVVERHARVFLAIAEASAPERAGDVSPALFPSLEEEHDNFRAALAHLLDHGGETYLRLATSLYHVWYFRGHLAEGRRWLEAGLARGRDASAPRRAAALRGAALLAQQQGDLAVARVHAEAFARVSDEIGDPTGVAVSKIIYGGVTMLEGDFDAASVALEASLAAGRELEDDAIVSYSLDHLGWMARRKGDLHEAIRLFEQALALARERGTPVVVCADLQNLGAMALEQGDVETASVRLREALALARELGHTQLLAAVFDAAAAVATTRRRFRRAICLAGSAERLRVTGGFDLDPVDLAFRDRYLVEAREALDDDELAATSAESSAIALDEALRLAKEEFEDR